MALSHSFAGKSVLITGGALGLGRAIVQKLARDNAVVTVVDKNESALKQLKSDIPNVQTVPLDLQDWNNTRKVIDSLGPMHHLVNNAGILLLAPFLQIGPEAFDKLINVNLKAVINVSQVVAQNMIKNSIQGTIVNVSSMSSDRAAKGFALYGASKAAVSNITKSMALELGRNGIRVNAICPAPIENTDMTNNIDPASKELLISANLKRASIRRLIDPEEPANLAIYLLSPQSSMITGQSVFIDGGFTTN